MGSNVWHLESGIWHLMSGISFKHPDIKTEPNFYL